jgi:hypothetical protein
MTDLTLYLVPVTVVAGLISILGVVLKASLRRQERQRQDDHQQNLPFAKRA